MSYCFTYPQRKSHDTKENTVANQTYAIISIPKVECFFDPVADLDRNLLKKEIEKTFIGMK